MSRERKHHDGIYIGLHLIDLSLLDKIRNTDPARLYRPPPPHPIHAPAHPFHALLLLTHLYPAPLTHSMPRSYSPICTPPHSPIPCPAPTHPSVPRPAHPFHAPLLLTHLYPAPLTHSMPRSYSPIHTPPLSPTPPPSIT